MLALLYSAVMKPDKLLISKCEGAYLLSLSPRTIDNLIKRNLLIAKKVGRRTLILKSSVDAFVASDDRSAATMPLIATPRSGGSSSKNPQLLATDRVQERADKSAPQDNDRSTNGSTISAVGHRVIDRDRQDRDKKKTSPATPGVAK